MAVRYGCVCMIDVADWDKEKYPIPPKRVTGAHNKCVHTPCPEGYLQWHEWARQASKTHAAVKCEHCGLWAVWLPKVEARAVNAQRLVALNAFLKSQGLKPIPKRDCEQRLAELAKREALQITRVANLLERELQPHGGSIMLKPYIRWMIRRDMAEVLEIERAAFEFPWFEEEFIRCLRQRHCIGMVAEHAEHAERVVGFMIYELHKSRLHIHNFAVAADMRRRGIGRQMIDKLVGNLSSQRRTRITLEVRETNLAAQVFFRSQGFLCTKILRDFYEVSPEDAYQLEYFYDERDSDRLLVACGRREQKEHVR